MNPFTKFLAQFLKSSKTGIELFIDHWDKVEHLVITIYKRAAIIDEDRETFAESVRWLQTHYPEWESEFASYWPSTVVGGRAAPMDPFRRLIDVAGPEAFIGDWEALQYLPAAREALNQYLVDQGVEAG